VKKRILDERRMGGGFHPNYTKSENDILQVDENTCPVTDQSLSGQSPDMWRGEDRLREGSSQKETTTPEVSLGERQKVWFSEFWEFYWRKVSKAGALAVYRRKVKTEEIHSLVVSALKAQSPSMMAREVEKRPHASTWLAQERWNDEIEAVSVNGHRKRGLSAEEIAAL
jgi:hypothetical protein